MDETFVQQPVDVERALNERVATSRLISKLTSVLASCSDVPENIHTLVRLYLEEVDFESILDYAYHLRYGYRGDAQPEPVAGGEEGAGLVEEVVQGPETL